MDDPIILYRYDRDSILELLRTTTVSALRQRLSEMIADAERRALLDATLVAWEWRALGALPLRDALRVDAARGATFYTQLCAAYAVERVACDGGLSPAALADQMRALAGDGHAVGVERGGVPEMLPLPDELESLLPPRPAALPNAPFEPPSGWRRALATALVALGAAWLAVQLALWGTIPVRPAGVPLGLFTLALLVGVRARWPGYLGSLCVWLVANLPGFHYTTVISWPELPLLAAGLALLSLDRRIRAMWAWAATVAYQRRSAMPPK